MTWIDTANTSAAKHLMKQMCRPMRRYCGSAATKAKPSGSIQAAIHTSRRCSPGSDVGRRAVAGEGRSADSEGERREDPDEAVRNVARAETAQHEGQHDGEEQQPEGLGGGPRLEPGADGGRDRRADGDRHLPRSERG